MSDMDNMNIFFLSDKNVAPYLTVVLESVKVNNPDSFLNIFVAYGELGEYEKKYIADVIPDGAGQVNFIQLSPEIQKVCNDIYGQSTEKLTYPLECQAKLLAAWILPEEVERCLYLDTDTLVIGNLREWYDMDFEGNCLMACQDLTLECLRTENSKFKKIFSEYNQKLLKRVSIYPEHRFFNAGVMMMDIKKIREFCTYETFCQAIKEIDNYVLWADQDLYNWVFRDSVKLVDSSKYNMQVSYDTYEAFYPYMDPKIAEGHVLIIHFLSKPWFVWERPGFIYGEIFQYWWKYASKTIFFEEWFEKLGQGISDSKRKENFWMNRSQLQLQKKSITDIIRRYFKREEANRIGIYGAGLFGRLLIEEKPKEYDYLIFDQKVKEVDGIVVWPPDKLEEVDLDILIITPFWIEHLQQELQEKTTAKLINYDFLIKEL